MKELEILKAVNELLKQDDVENYVEAITEMFETWFVSELINCSTADQRSFMLDKYKMLIEFFAKINLIKMDPYKDISKDTKLMILEAKITQQKKETAELMEKAQYKQ